MSQPLLGRVLNLGNSDIIQSVGQGGNDAAIDYRGISNYIKTKRVPYTITSQDAINNFAVIPVVWDTPFSDTNYTVMFSIEDLTGETADKDDFYPQDVHNKTASGFQAIVVSLITGNAIIHAIAIHD